MVYHNRAQLLTFLHNQLFLDAPQNYKTSVIQTFLYKLQIYYHFRRKPLTFWSAFKYFHLFTFSAFLSAHTKLRIQSGFLTAMWSLPDFYGREKIDYASMIGR